MYVLALCPAHVLSGNGRERSGKVRCLPKAVPYPTVGRGYVSA